MKILLYCFGLLSLHCICYASQEVCGAGSPDLVTTSCAISTHHDPSYLAILVSAVFILWMFVVSCVVL
ncbi:UL147A [Papio ursinus cytomegalovirus]|uniref:UL147A n=1 Tax=Papiine betaherpesvirus 4 TaxID=2560624 RepID=A0A0F7G993_9BETA|nr:UL147A [Papio ursinus cytomegalovirus]AKG51575.1 UL147A [Papiine betaherpesvirus 4]